PDRSKEEHKLLLALEERMMQALGIPYHVLDICSADLGMPAAAKFDVEAWMPGQNGGRGEYRETHSASNTTDFQARRLNVRFRSGQQKPEYVHMLNGTAFAIGRMLIAIMENYQRKDGTIGIPAALQPYMGGITEIKR
ncbi:MAG: aminoacyl--tRNA ligase-related protein, partial [Patescibacteria group bacterium]